VTSYIVACYTSQTHAGVDFLNIPRVANASLIIRGDLENVLTRNERYLNTYVRVISILLWFRRNKRDNCFIFLFKVLWSCVMFTFHFTLLLDVHGLSHYTKHWWARDISTVWCLTYMYFGKKYYEEKIHRSLLFLV